MMFDCEHHNLLKRAKCTYYLQCLGDDGANLKNGFSALSSARGLLPSHCDPDFSNDSHDKDAIISTLQLRDLLTNT